MIAQLLKQSFDRYFQAPIEAWEHFATFCEPVSFKKNEVIKMPNKAERAGYFILEGSGGVFIWNEKAEVCLDLMYDGEFFADYMSLITGEATPMETRALEDSQMLKIPKESIDQLKETPMGQAIFLISAESSYVEKQAQQIDLLLKTAEERYADLLSKQPKLIMRTSQKHIASYLGITQQSLSRIRKNVS